MGIYTSFSIQKDIYRVNLSTIEKILNIIHSPPEAHVILKENLH